MDILSVGLCTHFNKVKKMNSVKSIILFLMLVRIFMPVQTALFHAATLITITPTAFLSPTAAVLTTPTPFRTPSATPTHAPTQTPFVVTVIHTKIVTSFVSTPSPNGTSTDIAIPTLSTGNEKENSPQSLLSIAIVGMVATFIAGFVIGTLWSKVIKR